MSSELATAGKFGGGKKKKQSELMRRILKNKWIYLMIAPGVLYILIYKYIPMGWLVISFQEYKPYLGMSGSEWVGLDQFRRLFTSPDFWMLLRNTLVLFGLQILIFFPIPIVLALMLNEIRGRFLRKSIQTLIYLPHFMSWVVIVSISYVLLTLDGGIINGILESLGFEKVNFLLNSSSFRPMYIIQVIWREAGWGTIIFLAAIAAVDTQLYEAARMDGANRLRQLWHVTL